MFDIFSFSSLQFSMVFFSEETEQNILGFFIPKRDALNRSILRNTTSKFTI